MKCKKYAEYKNEYKTSIIYPSVRSRRMRIRGKLFFKICVAIFCKRNPQKLLSKDMRFYDIWAQGYQRALVFRCLVLTRISFKTGILSNSGGKCPPGQCKIMDEPKSCLLSTGSLFPLAYGKFGFVLTNPCDHCIYFRFAEIYHKSKTSKLEVKWRV